MRWRSSEGKGAPEVVAPTSLEGGLYGSKGWQDEEESPSEEEGRWQEEEVGNTFIEAIH